MFNQTLTRCCKYKKEWNTDMNQIRIFADSTCDLSKELVEKYDICRVRELGRWQ